MRIESQGDSKFSYFPHFHVLTTFCTVVINSMTSVYRNSTFGLSLQRHVRISIYVMQQELRDDLHTKCWAQICCLTRHCWNIWYCTWIKLTKLLFFVLYCSFNCRLRKSLFSNTVETSVVTTSHKWPPLWSSITSFLKYQDFPSQNTLFGTSCRWPPLVSDHDHFFTLFCF